MGNSNVSFGEISGVGETEIRRKDGHSVHFNEFLRKAKQTISAASGQLKQVFPVLNSSYSIPTTN